MDKKLILDSPANDKLAAILSVPKAPNGKAVLLLHCFTCTKHHRIMRGLAECLSQGGFTVLRFDFGGNGESGGNLEDATYTKMLAEINCAVAYLAESGISRIGVAGHSMGAMLALLAAENDRRIKAVGFISGSSQAARVREVFPAEAIRKAEEAGSAEAFVYGRPITLRREFLLDVERFNVGHAIATLQRPILIVHGTQDEVIPLFHARQVHAWASEPKMLLQMEGADHLFKKDDDLSRLREAVCAWFGQNL